MGACLAFARQSDLMAFVDARRHGHAQLAPPLYAAFATAGRAWLHHDLALAVAARTGTHVDHLAEHRRAHRADLTGAVALRAGRRRRARLGSAARACLATTERAELDLLVRAGDRLGERQSQVVSEVGTGGRTAATVRTRCALAEEGIEEIAEALEAAERAAALWTAEAGSPKGVVCLPTLGIGQDLIGLVDLLEAVVRACRGADVRMPLLGEPAEGPLDVAVRRTARHAEDVVVVTLGSHARRSIGSSGCRPIRARLGLTGSTSGIGQRPSGPRRYPTQRCPNRMSSAPPSRGDTWPCTTC